MTASGISFGVPPRSHPLRAVAASDPARYRVGVAAFAVIGYTYLLGVALALPAVIGLGVFVLAGTHVGAIAFEVLLPFVVLSFTLLRGLWVRSRCRKASPCRQRSTALFELIAELEPPARNDPSRLFYVNNFDATNHPRRDTGRLSACTSSLVLSEPLIKAPASRSFSSSSSAHEFGVSSATHGRLSELDLPART